MVAGVAHEKVVGSLASARETRKKAYRTVFFMRRFLRGSVRAPGTGDLVCLDTFYIGNLRRSAGRSFPPSAVGLLELELARELGRIGEHASERCLGHLVPRLGSADNFPPPPVQGEGRGEGRAVGQLFTDTPLTLPSPLRGEGNVPALTSETEHCPVATRRADASAGPRRTPA